MKRTLYVHVTTATRITNITFMYAYAYICPQPFCHKHLGQHFLFFGTPCSARFAIKSDANQAGLILNGRQARRWFLVMSAEIM